MLYSSSGSTGSGRQLLYPSSVRDGATKRAERFLELAPLQSGDLVAVLFGFGMFPPAHFYCDALANLGCQISPLGSGRNTRSDLTCEWLAQAHPHCLIAMPTYLLRLAHLLQRAGTLGSAVQKLQCLITGGEILHPSFREKLLRDFGVPVYDHYGMLEAPMIGGECSYGNMHVSSEYYCEVLSGNSIRSSGPGILILSSLNAWGRLPMLRVFTGDEVELRNQPCACGYSSSLRIKG